MNWISAELMGISLPDERYRGNLEAIAAAQFFIGGNNYILSSVSASAIGSFTNLSFGEESENGIKSFSDVNNWVSFALGSAGNIFAGGIKNSAKGAFNTNETQTEFIDFVLNTYSGMITNGVTNISNKK